MNTTEKKSKINSILFFFHPSGKWGGATLSVLSGVLLALAWPGRGMPLLLLFAFLPLLWLEHFLFENRHTKGRHLVFLYAWLGFGVFNLLTTWWIWNATPVGMLMAVIVNSAFMALAFWLFHITKRRFSARPANASLIIYWLAYEYMFTLWDLNWIWLNLGNGFANWPFMVQWYEFTGVSGGSFWILSVNLMVFFAIRQAYQGIHRPALYAVLAAILLLPILISVSLYFKSPIEGNSLKVALVQPGDNPYEDTKTADQIIGRINKLDMLMQKGATQGAHLVVVPEGSWPQTIWLSSGPMRMHLDRVYEFVLRNPSVDVVMGMMTALIYKDSTQLTASARPYRSTGYHYDYFNSAGLVTSNLDFSIYHKSVLVPGVEKMPFYKQLTFLKPAFSYFGGTTASMGTQEKPLLFPIQDSLYFAAPLVCYESVFGSYVRQFVEMGAGIVVLITNDGWWGHTPGHRQHLAYSRLRAIETRKYIARAAFNGVSAIIDTKGNIVNKTQYDTMDVLVGEVSLNTHKTFFVRNGDFIGRTALWCSMLLLIVLLSRMLIKKPLS